MANRNINRSKDRIKFPWHTLDSEFTGCSLSLDHTPNVTLVAQTTKITDDRRTRPSSRPLEFSEAGLVVYVRDSTPGQSTLVQVKYDDAKPELLSGVTKQLPQAEKKLPSQVLDLARIDPQHIVASTKGSNLDIWKKTDFDGFISMQVLTGCWRNPDSEMHLVQPRKDDSACLVASQNGLSVLQLDGQCNNLRSFAETRGLITSVSWHEGERFTFSSTVDTGHFVLYDVRASTPVSSAVVSDGGVYDHAKLDNYSVVVSGAGAVLNLLDLRKLDKPAARHLDPFQANIVELTASATNPMDLIALGEHGFTLWNSTGHGRLNFRALVEEPDAEGHVRGSFETGTTAFTTNAAGGLKAWKVKSGRLLTKTVPYKQNIQPILQKRGEATSRGPPLSPPRNNSNFGRGVHRGGVQLGASAPASAGKISLASEELSLWDWDEELPRDTSLMEEWPGRDPATAPAAATTATALQVGAPASGEVAVEASLAGRPMAAGATATTGLRPAGQNRPTASLRVHSEDVNSLPIKDLDELISFYLG